MTGPSRREALKTLVAAGAVAVLGAAPPPALQEVCRSRFCRHYEPDAEGVGRCTGPTPC